MFFLNEGKIYKMKQTKGCLFMMRTALFSQRNKLNNN